MRSDSFVTMSSDESDDGIPDQPFPPDGNALDPFDAAGDQSDVKNSSSGGIVSGAVTPKARRGIEIPSTRKLSAKSSKSKSPSSSSSRTRPMVKLLVTSVCRSYTEPWRRKTQRESSGTGFLIRWVQQEGRQKNNEKVVATTRPLAKNDPTVGAAAHFDVQAKDQSMEVDEIHKSTHSLGTNETLEANEMQSDNVDPKITKQSLRIVTNAHVVRNASTVRARASFGPHVVNCQVEWLSLPLDLALLKISDGDLKDFCKKWNFDCGEKVGDSGLSPPASLDASAGGKMEMDSNTNVKDVSKAESADARSNVSESKPTIPNMQANTIKNRSNLSNKAPPLHCLTISTSLPKLDENVTCVGFPQGGTQISVTRGVVSRIDVNSQYVLRIQIDAAINSGNSGGPVFDEQGQVVGVASSVLRGAGNIGYIVPGKIVSMFLSMCRDGMEASADERCSGLGTLIMIPDQGNKADNNDTIQSSNYRRLLDELSMLGGEIIHEPKHVPGIPSLAIHGAQTLESKALRKSLGLEELGISGGIRVIGVRGSKLLNYSSGSDEGDFICSGAVKKRKINDEDETKSEKSAQNSHADTSSNAAGEIIWEENKLRANDVLLSINNIEIGMDGSIQLSPNRPDERINFRSIVTSQRVGSKVILDVLRDRQRKQLEVTLRITQYLVPQYDDFDACPLYAVCGGCVFSPLSLPLISEKTGKRKNTSSTFNRFYQDQREGNDQVLILSKVLADEVNVGYHGWSNLLLKSVNGFEPKNIQELVDVIVRKLEGEMVEFRCQMVGLEEADFVLCMKMQEVLQSEQRILHRHMIASWCSRDALPSGVQEVVGNSTSTGAEMSVCWKSLKNLRAVLKNE